MAPADPLPYESRTPGALEFGETVLWEGEPLSRRRPPSLAAVFAVSSVALIVLLPGGVLLATADLVPPVLLLTLLILAGGAVAYWALRPRRNADVTFRVTNRRLVRAAPHGTAAEVGLSNLTGFRFEARRRCTTCRFDDGDQEGNAVAFERLEEPATVHRLLAVLPERIGRRARLRRFGHSSATRTANMQPIEHQPHPAPDRTHVDDELPLGVGEVVLWSGRPRPRDPLDVAFLLDRLKIVGWMLFPAAALFAHSGLLGLRFGHWATTGVAVVWLVMAMHALTLGPWLAVRRRHRTRYYLTNVRAVDDVVGRARLTRSVFLDMVSDSTVTVRDGVVGDLHLLGGSFNFERVEDVWKLHRVAMEAIRGAGAHPPADNGRT